MAFWATCEIYSILFNAWLHLAFHAKRGLKYLDPVLYYSKCVSFRGNAAARTVRRPFHFWTQMNHQHISIASESFFVSLNLCSMITSSRLLVHAQALHCTLVKYGGQLKSFIADPNFVRSSLPLGRA
eukprot:5968782-Amphidinium_carterae.1